jgi:hypothetical protein
LDLQEREHALTSALDVYRDENMTRTEHIEFRGKPMDLKVVRVSPILPLLNHENSRVSAQLKNHPLRDIVYKDPTSKEAQDVLAEILSKTDKFSDLKEELKHHGQVNAGIITRQGVLVNGNTRLVAARMADLEGFDVAVLPADATSEDCFDIEMSLQLRKLTHQDYTLTNRLLLVARYTERGGHSDDELIKRMGWIRGGRKKLALHRQMLGLIEEIRDASPTPLDYQFFDTKEQMLKDLLEKYDALSSESFQEAQDMKWMRVLGMVLGVNKDQVRAIDEDFMEDNLAQRVSGNSAGTFLEQFERVAQGDPLDELLDSQSSNEPQVDFRAAVSQVLSETVEPSGHMNAEALENFHELTKQMRAGAEAVIEQEKQNNSRMEPSERLAEARMRVEDIADRLPELFKDGSFDRRKFEFETKKVLKAVNQLNEELTRQLGKQAQ